MKDEYKDALHLEDFDSIEEALMTKCPICGTPLDWELKLIWIDEFERNFIYGYASSCSINFEIRPSISSNGVLSGYTIHLD